MAPLLAVEDLHAGYGFASVLRGVTLEVQAGEVVSLLGRNGMGKTTTVRAIMGLLRPARGTVRVRGIAQQGRPCHEVARAGIGLVPEGRQVFPNRSRSRRGAARRPCRSLDPAPGVRAVSAAGRAPASGRTAVGRRAADGGDRPCADDQPGAVDSRRGQGLAPLVRAEIWRCLAGLKAGVRRFS